MIALTIIIIVNTSPIQSQMALGPGFYDDSTPLIEYLDVSWSQVCSVGSGMWLDCRMTTSIGTHTARIRFYVWGDDVTIYLTRQPSGGDIFICINTSCSTINNYNATVVHMASYQVTGLGWGTHEIILQKYPTNTGLNLDAVYVSPPAPAPTIIPPTPVVVITVVAPESTQYVNVANWDEASVQVEMTDDPSLYRFDVDDSEGNPRPVSLKYEINAGQIASLIIQAGSLVMLMVILILTARRQS